MKARGLRNNNPLNIRRGKTPWEGETDKIYPVDPLFCQFRQMRLGWRAALLLLTRTYYSRYHLYTIRAIVTRWAPPTENDTEGYIREVAALTRISDEQPLGLPSANAANWLKVAVAMAIVENGEHEMRNEVFASPLDFLWSLFDGWRLAMQAQEQSICGKVEG